MEGKQKIPKFKLWEIQKMNMYFMKNVAPLKRKLQVPIHQCMNEFIYQIKDLKNNSEIQRLGNSKS